MLKATRRELSLPIINDATILFLLAVYIVFSVEPLTAIPFYSFLILLGIGTCISFYGFGMRHGPDQSKETDYPLKKVVFLNGTLLLVISIMWVFLLLPNVTTTSAKWLCYIFGPYNFAAACLSPCLYLCRKENSDAAQKEKRIGT